MTRRDEATCDSPEVPALIAAMTWQLPVRSVKEP